MYAVTVTAPGELGWAPAADPLAGPGDVVIDVAAAGVNRADLLQARGGYPPPAGASPILGLECAGIVTEVHGSRGGGIEYDDTPGSAPTFAVGDRVCALLSGGGYAERVAVPATQVLPVPAGMPLEDAAALPEVVCTVWSNLVMTAGLTAGQTVLIHGGGSGVGTMAVQIAVSLGAHPIVTASSAEKLSLATDLGAEVAIDYTNEDFVIRVHEATGGRGADAILDVVGADYLARNIAALADGGRLVVIGLLGGARAELDLAALMAKRAGVIGTQLRSRPAVGHGSKAEIVAEVRRRVWPLIESGTIRPVIGARVSMDDAGRAHRLLRGGGVLGKAILTRETAGRR